MGSNQIDRDLKLLYFCQKLLNRENKSKYPLMRYINLKIVNNYIIYAIKYKILKFLK